MVVVETDAGWESVGALEALRACDFARLVRALGVSVGKWYFVVIRVLGLDVSSVPSGGLFGLCWGTDWN